MPVLGTGGQLKLKRDAPDPCVLLPGGFDWNTNTVDLDCTESYWTGDHVCLQGPSGLPIVDNNVPGAIDGVATYFGSSWYVGPNRSHITSNTDDFYKKGTELIQLVSRLTQPTSISSAAIRTATGPSMTTT